MVSSLFSLISGGFRWVHVVCALYVPGVAFGDIDKLRPVTLTEMNYSKYGAKASIFFYLIYAACHKSTQKDPWQKEVAQNIFFLLNFAAA